MDEPDAKTIVAASQGSHVVLPKAFLPGNSAIMVPHTPDGRVLLGARASIEAAPRVAELMAKELKQDTDWQKKTVQNFQEVAQGYLPPK